MSSVVTFCTPDAIGRAPLPPPDLHLEALEAEEQFVLWVLRNWVTGTSRWSRLWTGVNAYLGASDSPAALRAFGDTMLCAKYNGRHSFCAGAPGCPVTPDELSILSLVSAHQHDNSQLADGLALWLVSRSAQQILLISSAQFAEILLQHNLLLPDRSCAEDVGLRAAS